MNVSAIFNVGNLGPYVEEKFEDFKVNPYQEMGVDVSHFPS